MMQTFAIFKDAYRELNAKRLFWVVLGLSVLVVAAFAAVGVNEKGLTILWWEFPSIFNSTLFPPELFYKLIFANLGVKIWLTWIAAILALVSTASIIPDFISSGSIELSLSKPIGRARLFLTKYLSGMLFVTLQVLVFTTAAYLVIGLRGKVWEEGLFWAVPLTVLCFSFIFSICVLFGLLTRSTITSLILTLLMWFAIFGIHTTENTLLYFKFRREAQVEKVQSDIARFENSRNEHNAAEAERIAAPGAEPAAAQPWGSETELENRRKRLVTAQESSKSMSRWHQIFFSAMTVLPKTSETIEVLERKLISDADLEELRDRDEPRNAGIPGEDISVNEKKLQTRVQDTIRGRSIGWVIGTSVAFEAFILLIATWIFTRREF